MGFLLFPIYGMLRSSAIIASVSPTKITRSHGPITLWMWMFSTLLHLLVYSLTVGFCTISQQFQSVASKLSLFTNDPFSKLSGSWPLWFFVFRIARSRTVWVAVFCYSAVSTASRFLFFLVLSVTWPRPPLGQMLVRTFNHETCNVKSPKTFDTLIHQNVTHCFLCCV